MWQELQAEVREDHPTLSQPVSQRTFSLGNPSTFGHLAPYRVIENYPQHPRLEDRLNNSGVIIVDQEPHHLQKGHHFPCNIVTIHCAPHHPMRLLPQAAARTRLRSGYHNPSLRSWRRSRCRSLLLRQYSAPLLFGHSVLPLSCLSTFPFSLALLPFLPATTAFSLLRFLCIQHLVPMVNLSVPKLILYELLLGTEFRLNSSAPRHHQALLLLGVQVAERP